MSASEAVATGAPDDVQAVMCARVLVAVTAQSVDDVVTLPQLRVLVMPAGRGGLNPGPSRPASACIRPTRPGPSNGCARSPRRRGGCPRVRSGRWAGPPPTDPSAGCEVHGDGRTGRRLAATLTVPEGGQHDLVQEVSDSTLDGGAPDAGKLWAATETAWREVMPALGRSIAPRDARHACCAG